MGPVFKFHPGVPKGLAREQDFDGEILAGPQIIVRSGEEGRIQVGEELGVAGKGQAGGEEREGEVRDDGGAVPVLEREPGRERDDDIQHEHDHAGELGICYAGDHKHSHASRCRITGVYDSERIGAGRDLLLCSAGAG